jgi:MoaA/NifB/PqqE/SkfB family radical SAM enzyme
MFELKLIQKALHTLRAEGVGALISKIDKRFFRCDFEVPAKLDMVVVDITTYCNLKCAGCVRSILVENGSWKNRHMSVENYRKLVDDLPPATLFCPQGLGEPTMHPQIVEIIKIASDAGNLIVLK